MDDLQNQTQELPNNLLMGKIVKHDEIKGLLRRIVEECCKAADWYDPSCGAFVNNNPSDPIYEKFAWLLEEDK